MVALSNNAVYIELVTKNDNVNALTALTAPLMPSVTLKVILKVAASLACGVIVNTLLV